MNDDDENTYSIEGTDETEHNPKYSLAMESAKKGQKVYQSKAENIHVMQTDNDKNLPLSNFENDDQVDHVLSGESLYKTYTFEQSSNEEDVEKCIAFWKGVMQKNLEPIKCSIIEDSKNKLLLQPQTKESVERPQKESKMIKEAEQKIHDFYKSMWTNALKELQKSKLDDMELIGKSRCKMCETPKFLSESSFVSHEELTELNKWQPESGETGRGSRKSDALQGRHVSIQKDKKIVCICSEPDEALQEVVSVDTIVSDRMFVTRDTARYKLLDLINEKKKRGIYSMWRKNVLPPCTCGEKVCDCNLNPAIVSIQQPPEKTCGCGLLNCQCKNASQQSLEEKVSKQAHDLPCDCGNEYCTCQHLEPISAPSTNTLPPKPLEVDSDESEESKASRETILYKASEAVVTEKTIRTQPIKKSSKADITKVGGSDSASQLTLEFPRSVSDTWGCLCGKEDCKCTEETLIRKQTTKSKMALH